MSAPEVLIVRLPDRRRVCVQGNLSTTVLDLKPQIAQQEGTTRLTQPVSPPVISSGPSVLLGKMRLSSQTTILKVSSGHNSCQRPLLAEQPGLIDSLDRLLKSSIPPFRLSRKAPATDVGGRVS